MILPRVVGVDVDRGGWAEVDFTGYLGRWVGRWRKVSWVAPGLLVQLVQPVGLASSLRVLTDVGPPRHLGGL